MTAILFDVDDTLYDQLEPFRLACGQVLGTDFRADYACLYAAGTTASLFSTSPNPAG